MSIWLGFLGTTITAIAALIGVLWVARSSRQAAAETTSVAREVARTAPYDVLAKQVVDLLKRVECLERDRRDDRRYVHALLDAWKVHLPDTPPPKPPPWVYGTDPPSP